MLDGWRAQQLARNLAFGTIYKRLNSVRAFARHADAFPWSWRSQMIDEWLADLRGGRRATVRNYAASVAAFCDYLTNPAYDWVSECERRFGSHPVQVVHEWNTAVHVQDAESDPARRAFTLDELQGLFDYADDRNVAEHMRHQLVACGILLAVDAQLIAFEGWIHRRLGQCADHPHQRLLRQFGLWHQLSRLRADAATRPLRPTAKVYAVGQVHRGAEVPDLATRPQHRTRPTPSA